ncbi:MAG: MATE family efflux transporter [Treponema sp.]|jgi:putative MATE family efflux protein|nr:MATE family efflux transporter [Treponema sp.]
MTSTGEMALDRVEMGNDEQLERDKKGKIADTLPRDITSKMVYRDIVRIAWPSMVEMILTQLASMVDLMMVGQLGPEALNAVGLTTQPKFLTMTLFMAMNVGATAMVARCKGAGDPKRANLMLRQAIIMTFFLSSAAALLGYIFAEQLIVLMGAADPAVISGGSIYFKIQMAGLPLLALTATATATLRGVGNSRTPMVYNLMANLINVVFNYLLIYGNFGFPRWEVAGASLATVIGQTAAFFMALISLLWGKNYIRLQIREGFMPNAGAIRSIVNIGFPAMLEQLVMRAGMIIYTRMIAGLGVVSFATHQICMSIQAFSFMNGQAFAISATSLTGQSLGKKRIDMAQIYTTRTRRVGMGVSLVIALVSFIFGGRIVALYTSGPGSAEIINTGAKLMMMVALIQPLQSSQFILAGSLRGAGDTKSVAAIIFVTILIVRPLIAYLFIYVFETGVIGAWVGFVVDQAMRSLFVLLRYYSGKWKSIKV